MAVSSESRKDPERYSRPVKFLIPTQSDYDATLQPTLALNVAGALATTSPTVNWLNIALCRWQNYFRTKAGTYPPFIKEPP